jgi:predicted dehydrogenase
MPATRIVGLADPEVEKARALATEIAGAGHGIEIRGDAAAAMRETPSDIIDIAAPPHAHLDLIRAAFETEARVVICQKPFCGGLEGGREAAALAEADGRPLVVHENFRFQPWYRRMRAEIEAGTLGDVLQIAFRLRPGDGQGPDAYLGRQPYFQKMRRFLVHETAVHWIDTFRFLMGEPRSVFADLRRLNPAISGEDAGTILFRFSDGRRGLFDGNRLVDHAAEDMRLTMGECLLEGTEATIALDGRGQLRLRRRGEAEGSPIGTPRHDGGFGGGCVAALQAHVVAHLTDGAPLENTARSYLRVQEIEEAVYRSAREGRLVEL